MNESDVLRTAHLMNVALGKEKAHLVVTNATLANVYSGELLENQAVCIWGQWIAYVGQNPQHAIGADTTVIDALGKPLIPGFIDGHTHMAGLYTAEAFLKYAIPGGTTAIVTETADPYTVCGLPGVVDFMDSLADQPIHFFGTVPPVVSISTNHPPITGKDLDRLMARTDMVGLGESYWQAVVTDPKRMLPVLDGARLFGKPLEGHSAGASNAKLNAYAAAGITSCHEPIKAQEALERLRLGLYVMIREGSIRRDLQEIATLKKSGIDSRRLILVTDGVTPGELLEKGYMEYVVQKAIDCGFSPMEAIQMATVNPATHFHLDHIIGAIAPGRYADMAILPDLQTIRPELVMAKGRVIAQQGQCLVSPRVHRFQPASLNSVNLAADWQPADFSIPGPKDQKEAPVRVIDMITDLVTQEAQLRLAVKDGYIQTDLSRDIVKVAAINRTSAPGQRFVGLIRGFGIKDGALACSTGWDAADIVVVGVSEADMALAVNRLCALKGGVVICRSGAIAAQLALPIFGLLAPLSVQDLADATEAIGTAARGLGITFRDPVLTLSTLTGAAIPFLRICEQGLVNLKSGPRPLIVSPSDAHRS